ncbi:hypothetical protein GCM10010276_00220 [Streptomyces longisporus]|uniref:Uncharacterized protein n=1 Tax=Streptomyces longisporus TaxID=1948 RepID=A0ABP5XWA3_STRLO
MARLSADHRAGFLLRRAPGPAWPCGARLPTRPWRDSGTSPTRDRVSCRTFCTVHPEGACATYPPTRDADRVGKLSAIAVS